MPKRRTNFRKFLDNAFTLDERAYLNSQEGFRAAVGGMCTRSDVATVCALGKRLLANRNLDPPAHPYLNFRGF